MIQRVVIGLIAGLVLAGTAAAEDHSLAERLATASPDKGETMFKRCRACHTIENGGAHSNGPNLWGVVGRPIASAEGFGKYSDALLATGGVWSVERIDAFLTSPHQDIQGTRMPFVGLDQPHRRADLIAYLNGNSPAPLDFSAGAVPGSPPIEEEPPEYGVFFVADGVEETYAYCSACHSERLIAQQGLDREDWIELLEWLVENPRAPILDIKPQNSQHIQGSWRGCGPAGCWRSKYALQS